MDEKTTCCIVGCGPAGAMLGLLLARAGVDVVVLEKYADFHRDFRGDTIHASTLQVLDELDLLDGFERLPQQHTSRITVLTDDGAIPFGDFTRLPGRFQYISFVPQWDFLTFVTDEASRYPSFGLRQRAEFTGLLVEDGRVRGVRYRSPDGEHVLRAALTVGADGRHSAVRRAAGLTPVEFGAPMDVLWFRVPREDGDPSSTFARLTAGRLFPMIDRRTYWQGAYTMTKGSYADLKARGIETLRAELAQAMPFLDGRLEESLRSWDDVGFLEVRVNRLRRWHRPGMLCIGDAAHAMSPIAGVGINLAIQDAVAAANRLTEPLRRGSVDEDDLAAVQRRRMLPTRVTQAVQRGIQRNMISPLLERRSTATVPRPLRVAFGLPVLRRGVARFMAIGVRNEHVAQVLSAEAAVSSSRRQRTVLGAPAPKIVRCLRDRFRV
jgi:2-polyprenyl-6-methoxyphenol hydroxylase-like FAD-dependent oxidoreductase